MSRLTHTSTNHPNSNNTFKSQVQAAALQIFVETPLLEPQTKLFLGAPGHDGPLRPRQDNASPVETLDFKGPGRRDSLCARGHESCEKYFP